MWTPVIGITPIDATGDDPTLSSFGAESGDVGIFEQVLHELLDSDTEAGGDGAWISLHLLPPPSTVWEKATTADPHPLNPSLTLWEGENVALLSRQVGVDQGVGAIITEPAPLDNGTTPEFKNLASSADFSNPTPLSPISVNGEGGSAALRTPGSPSPFTGRGSEGEALFNDFLTEPGASTGLGQPADAPLSSAQGDALPLPSARQGETPPAPASQTRPVESVEITPAERGALPPRQQDHSEPATAEQHHIPPHPALAPTHPAGLVGQGDALHGTVVEPLADPNWRAAEQIAQHIERMGYDHARDAVIMRLDPPELGVIELRVQTTGNEVQAWVNAERDLTRQLLQQAQHQLREQLESRGLQLAHFDVGGRSHPHFGQARPSRTPATQSVSHTHPSTATDSLIYDGRWSVWV